MFRVRGLGFADNQQVIVWGWMGLRAVAWEATTGKLLAAEYYDHARDPNELTNQLDQAKDSEVLKAARRALHTQFSTDTPPSKR